MSLSDPTTPVAIALGSNLGHRLENLRFGLTRLRLAVQDLRVSSVYETEPAHDPDQALFLNACVTGRTRLSARQLLSELQDAERAAGRRRSSRRWGPRTLDLDLLLYGVEVVREPWLIIPHPRLHARAFVLLPLTEIAPHWVVPAAPDREAATVSDLAATVAQTGIARTEYEL